MPFSFEEHYISTPVQIYQRLNELIEVLDKIPKTGSKSQD